jgi:arylsulfatase A-like enzyme/tetratricopeptide (TPR) repeat protein
LSATPSRRRLIIVVLLAVSVAAILAWRILPGQARLPSSTPVLIVTIDTLRPDALGFVAGRNETPRIDALARSGVAFGNAVSATPLTLPSHTSLMSGRYPARHGIRDNGQVLPESVHVLAERLRENGYATGAFVSAYVLRAMFGLDRGFDHYDDELTEGKEGWLDRPAAQTIDAALPWIEAHRNEPWFVWIHLYDPHTPYAPPADFAGSDPHSNYEGEVRYVDRELGRLLDRLAEWQEHPLIVLTADHGEAFGEHGEEEHGLFIYDTTTLVPLIFQHDRIPPSQPSGQPRLVDVTPTILDLLGITDSDQPDGISLVPALLGESLIIPDAYSETFHPWTTYGWSPLAALHHDGWKVIDGPDPELYDLRSDPMEKKNLVQHEAARADRLILSMESHRNPPDATDSTRIDDEATMRKLASLGYVGNASTTDVPKTGLANPRDMLRERDLLRNAEFLMRSGQLERALQVFDKVLETDPDNRYATLRAGISLLKLNRLPEAVERLQASLKLDPGQAETHYALADALSRSGRLAEAVPQWMETVRLQPRRAAAWGNLALVLNKLGRQAESMSAIKTALEIEPESLQLLQNLALQQRVSGDRAGSIATLEKAAQVGGSDFLYVALLGLQLYDEGRIRDAQHWLSKVKPNDRNYAESLFRLAQIKLGDDVPDEARKLLVEAIQRNPSLKPVALADPKLKELLSRTPGPG